MLKDLLILFSVFKLDHVLHEVVTVRILNQLTNVANDEVSELKLLALGPFLEASLHNTAAVLVLSNWNTVVNASFEDEVSVLARLHGSNVIIVLWPLSCFEHHKQRLNHVISVHVNCQIHNLFTQFTDHNFQNAVVKSVRCRKIESIHFLDRLLEVISSLHDVKLSVDSLQDALGESLDQDLDNSSTMNVQRYLDNVVLDVSDKAFDGCWIGNLHDSLAQIVSELIDHDI